MDEQTMIERVARALWEKSGKPHHADSGMPSMAVPELRENWRAFVPAARAVLTAMRVPSEAMLLATTNGTQTSMGNARYFWEMFIDAALAEEPR